MLLSPFIHPSFHSCHYHDAFTNTIRLVAAFKVEQDLQDRRREERERESQALM